MFRYALITSLVLLFPGLLLAHGQNAAKPPGAEAVASEEQAHGVEPEPEFAAATVEAIPQLAPVEPSPPDS